MLLSVGSEPNSAVRLTKDSKASIKPNTSKASISAATARNWLLFGIAAGPTPYLVVVLIPTFL
jgi:hypothetical protein